MSSRCVIVRGSAAAAAALISAAGAALGQCVPGFTPGPNLSMPNAFAVVVGDVNMDGRPDVIAAPNAPGGSLAVFHNLGGGTFTPRMDFGFIAGEARHMVLADITIDGIPDVAVTTDQGLELFWNFVNNFQQSPMEHFGQLRQIATADMDGDGTADLVTASVNPARVDVLLNPGAGFLQAFSTPTPVPVNGVYLTDFNFDGRPDAIICGGGSSGVYRLTNTGAGQLFNVEPIMTGVGGNALVGADLNADGQIDLLNMQPNMARANQLVGDSPGFFTPGPQINTTSSGLQWLPAVADVTGDFQPEVILPFFSRVNIYQSTGPFTYGPPTQVPTDAGAAQVVAADLNDDGAPDLVVTNPTAGTISILFNTGGGQITVHPQPATTEFGGTASFEVAATITGPNPTYQWLRNGQMLVEGGHFVGVNTHQLNILAATELEAGVYECLINACGQIRSNPATLTVGGCPSADYNRDGDVGTDADIEAFFRVLGGGGC